MTVTLRRNQSSALSWADVDNNFSSLQSEIDQFSTFQSWSPAFADVTVSSYSTRSGRYIKIGPCVFFTIELVWTGLDTSDTSSIKIPLPVGRSVKHISASINDKDSSGVTVPSVVVTPSSGYGGYLSFSDSSDFVSYNSGKIAASGNLLLSGQYWVEA